jgi:PIN domain nuclease of toxin-antitoxin system
MIVLDTAALLFWTLDPTQLSQPASQSISKADRIVISSISVWEIGSKVKRGKLQIPLPISEYVERLQKLDRLEILPVDVAGWLDNLDLSWEHRDPADRTIVALAKRFNCSLITSDQRMAGYYPKVVW